MKSDEVVMDEEDIQGQKNMSSPNTFELLGNIGEKQSDDYES